MHIFQQNSSNYEINLEKIHENLIIKDHEVTLFMLPKLSRCNNFKMPIITPLLIVLN